MYNFTVLHIVHFTLYNTTLYIISNKTKQDIIEKTTVFLSFFSLTLRLVYV